MLGWDHWKHDYLTQFWGLFQLLFRQNSCFRCQNVSSGPNVNVSMCWTVAVTEWINCLFSSTMVCPSPHCLQMWCQACNSTKRNPLRAHPKTYCIFMIYSSWAWIIEDKGLKPFWTAKCYSDTDAVSHVPESSGVCDSPPDVIKIDWAWEIRQRCCLCHHHSDSIVSAESIWGRQAAGTPAFLTHFSITAFGNHFIMSAVSFKWCRNDGLERFRFIEQFL